MYRSISTASTEFGSINLAVPFQVGRSVRHQVMSACASAFRPDLVAVSFFTESRMRSRNDIAVRVPSTFSMATNTPSFIASPGCAGSKRLRGAARKKIVEVVDEVTQLVVMSQRVATTSAEL